jgi:hypothetical protein
MKKSDYCTYVSNVSHHYPTCQLICAVSCLVIVFLYVLCRSQLYECVKGRHSCPSACFISKLLYELRLNIILGVLIRTKSRKANLTLVLVDPLYIIYTLQEAQTELGLISRKRHIVQTFAGQYDIKHVSLRPI